MFLGQNLMGNTKKRSKTQNKNKFLRYQGLHRVTWAEQTGNPLSVNNGLFPCFPYQRPIFWGHEIDRLDL